MIINTDLHNRAFTGTKDSFHPVLFWLIKILRKTSIIVCLSRERERERVEKDS